MGDVVDMPPRGAYLAADVGRLAGVSGKTVGQWARRGFIRSSRSAGRPRVYSYQDVAEAMLVHELLVNHVRHREIKATIKTIREERPTNWPLATSTLRVTLGPPSGRTSPRSAWLLLEQGGRYVRPYTSETQGVLEIQTALVARDLERGGWAVRELTDLEHIEVDPERLSGKPVIRGRRVSAEQVALLAAEPDGEQTLREGYDLTPEEINDAVRWWAAVSSYEDVAA